MHTALGKLGKELASPGYEASVTGEMGMEEQQLGCCLAHMNIYMCVHMPSVPVNFYQLDTS